MNLAELLQQARGNTYHVNLRCGVTEVLYEARMNIRSYVSGKHGYDFPAIWRDDFWDRLWESVGFEVVNKSGKIAKRIRSYLWKTHSISLLEDQVSAIGNHATADSTINGEYLVTFVHRKIDLWSPGEYGDYGSCYWGDRRGAPGSIFGAEGAGITVRRASDGEAIGRAWCVVPAHTPGIAIWNFYCVRGENWRMSSLGYLLTQGEGSPFYGAAMRPNDFTNNGEQGATVYINTTGLLLYDSTSNTEPSRWVDLGIEVEDECECESCGRVLHEDYAMHYDGYAYCEECYPAANCYHCGYEYDRDDMVYVDGINDHVCNDCYSENYAQCDHCHETVERDETTIVLRTMPGYYSWSSTRRVEYVYCDYCASDHAVICDDCNSAVHVDDAISVNDGDRTVCADCAPEYDCDLRGR